MTPRKKKKKKHIGAFPFFRESPKSVHSQHPEQSPSFIRGPKPNGSLNHIACLFISSMVSFEELPKRFIPYRWITSRLPNNSSRHPVHPPLVASFLRDSPKSVHSLAIQVGGSGYRSEVLVRNMAIDHLTYLETGLDAPFVGFTCSSPLLVLF